MFLFLPLPYLMDFTVKNASKGMNGLVLADLFKAAPAREHITYY